MDTENILELHNITKQYPGVLAVDDISLKFKKGEIHAIVGENGAGKSTLIKIITGAETADRGEIHHRDQRYKYKNPQDILKAGLTAIYQEFNLVPYLSVADNIFFGREIMQGPFINQNHMRETARELLDDLHVPISPDTAVKDLDVAFQQIVEIAKAISCEADLLIMDEPTAALTNSEIKELFRIVNRLKSNGVTVIYISHRLEEIFAICDRVTVFRDGKYITTKDVSQTNRTELISYMVGRELGESFVGGSGEQGEVVLEVKGLTTNGIKDVSFAVNKGEILGFGGLVGAGRTEVARVIFGADKLLKGEIYLNGSKIAVNTPRDAIGMGIGLVPEDRKQQGAILGLTVKENISYSSLIKLTNKGFINDRQETKMVNGLVQELNIKTPTIDQAVNNLSGGNQQKTVLAKWLATQCDVLIFDEPTRGIDVGAKQEIYALMNKLSKEGKAIIMISSEMPELLGMSDRIVVFNKGRIAGILNKEQATQELILDMASES